MRPQALRVNSRLKNTFFIFFETHEGSSEDPRSTMQTSASPCAYLTGKRIRIEPLQDYTNKYQQL